jgi:hypothetical protein
MSTFRTSRWGTSLFALAPFENAVEDAIQELLDDITLDHTYVPTLSEGQATIDGSP